MVDKEELRAKAAAWLKAKGHFNSASQEANLAFVARQDAEDMRDEAARDLGECLSLSLGTARRKAIFAFDGRVWEARLNEYGKFEVAEVEVERCD